MLEAFQDHEEWLELNETRVVVERIPPVSSLDTSVERPPVQIRNGTFYVRASSLGSCPRALAALIMGERPGPESEHLRRTAEEGHLHEDAVARKIQTEMGLRLTIRQDQCNYTHRIGDYMFTVTGHREGIWSAGTVPMFLWENKSKSKAEFKKWISSLDYSVANHPVPTFSNHPGHAWQISHYMMCPPDLPVMYTVKDRDSGELSYSYVDQAPFTEDDIRARLQQVIDIVEMGPGALHDNTLCDPQANKWFCGFRDTLSCMQTYGAELDGYEALDDDELELDLMLYENLKAEASRVKKEKDEVSGRIKTRVKSGGIVTPTGYSALIGVSEVVDWDKLKGFLAEHNASLKDFKKKTQRLTTKRPKGL